MYFWLCWTFVAAHRLFPSCWACSLVEVLRLLTAVASVVAGLGLWGLGLIVVVHGLVAPWHVGSSQTRDRIMSPTFTVRFLTTGPPGKSCMWFTCMLSHFSCVQLCATLRTVACQASLSMRFPRQAYWSGPPFPSLEHLPDSGIKPVSVYISCIGRWVLYH